MSDFAAHVSFQRARATSQEILDLTALVRRRLRETKLLLAQIAVNRPGAVPGDHPHRLTSALTDALDAANPWHDPVMETLIGAALVRVRELSGHVSSPPLAPDIGKV